MAQRQIDFDRQVSELGPGYYNCSNPPLACTRRDADMRNGCPNCRYTQEFESFKAGCKKAFVKDAENPHDNRWPFEVIVDDLNEVALLDVEHKRGYKPNWTVLTVALINIYRTANIQARRVDNWNLQQKLKALEKKGQQTEASDDGDEG